MQQFLEKKLLDQSVKFTSHMCLAPMDLKSKFHLQIMHTHILACDIKRKKSIRGRIAYPKCHTCSHQRGVSYSLNMKTQKKVNLAWRNRRLALRKLVRNLILPPGSWMRTLSAFLPAQCVTHKEPYLRRKGKDNYSCLFIVQRVISCYSGLQNGYKIGASL